MSRVKRNDEGLFYRQDGELTFYYNNAEHRFYCSDNTADAPGKRNSEFIAPPHYPLSISWLLEPSCNLDCIYCFADDCLGRQKTKSIESTVEAILSLNPLVMMMSGGEPTLNPDLEKVMVLAHHRCGLVLDTNGTLLLKKKGLLDTIKRFHVLVRITVDSFNEEILSATRPPKKSTERTGALLRETIQALVENDIEFAVHTVITRFNYDDIPILAKELDSLHVKRWLVYTVVPSKKMGDRYDDISVSNSEVVELRQKLKDLLANSDMRVSVSNDSRKNTKTNIMVDSNGSFFTDSYINPHKEKLCQDDLRPKIEEITKVIDMHDHAAMYLKL